MRLPNMKRAISRWAKPRTVKTLTRNTTDFVESKNVVKRDVRAMIQPADPEKLNVDQIDWSLAYIEIHAESDIAIGEYIEYDGEDYKIIARGGWTDYGFVKLIGEQTNRAAL